MNFKKTWNRSEGFTLVELIVVIAILAILAGVAVPAYSGYIKKAEKAADLQLLGAVNTAFAAAALENGDDVSVDITNATLTYGGTEGAKTVTGVASVSGTSSSVAAYNEAFGRYFAGNEGAVMKVMTHFVWANGAFVDPANTDGYSAYTYNGQTVYLSQSDVAALSGSTFMTNPALGTDNLLNKVDDVAAFGAALLDSDDPSTFATLMGGDDYMRFLANTIGVDNADALSGDDLFNAISEKGVSLGMTEDNASSFLTNGAVLYAAQNSATMTADDMVSLLGSGNGRQNILDTLKTDSGEAMAQAALAYGMYTAYAYNSGDPDLIAKTQDPMSIMDELGDEDFLKYINNADNSGQSIADAQGYIGALNMINSSVESSQDATLDVLTQGFANDDLKALLGSLNAQSSQG